MAFRRMQSLGLLLLPAACMQGGHVDVEQRGGATLITVTGGDARTCVEDLDVVPVEPAGAAPVWTIHTSDADVCVSRFVFGRSPPGYYQPAPAAALTKGRVYRVEVAGSGFLASRSFALGDADGPINRDPAQP